MHVDHVVVVGHSNAYHDLIITFILLFLEAKVYFGWTYKFRYSDLIKTVILVAKKHAKKKLMLSDVFALCTNIGYAGRKD